MAPTSQAAESWRDSAAAQPKAAVPPTVRGRRTRQRLLDAAAVVFERDGYLDAKILDITVEAGVSSGTFYTYFASKEAIFTAVIGDVVDRMFAAATVPPEAKGPAPVRIEYATRAYLRAYAEHAGMMAILEQVATFNPAFREMRRTIRHSFRTRTENGIRHLQEQGRVDPTLPPRCTAEALTSMVSNFCYASLVLEAEGYEEEEAVRTLTTLWVRGIGLTPQDREARP
jgi:AcrR family transcriptional regulator